MTDPTPLPPSTDDAPPSPPLRWECVAYPQLTVDALYALLQLRQIVFVVEQNCPFLDADGHDADAWHLLGWTTDATGRPQLGAYARLLAPGLVYPESSIGRVATHPAARRTGLGRTLMREALRELDARAPGTPVRIAAQCYLERFYTAFGFHRAGPDYEEDGIPHFEMLRPTAALTP